MEDIFPGGGQCADSGGVCMRTEEYLTLLTDQVRCKMARAGIQNEIQCHIEDQISCFEEEGIDSAEAEQLAVTEMGDPIAAGAELDRIHRPKMAWGVISLIGILSLAGYLILDLLQRSFGTARFLPDRSQYLFYLFSGFAVIIGICFSDYSRIGRRAREITVVLSAVLTLGLLSGGMALNGVVGWFRFLGIAIDVKVVLFFFIPLYGAVLYNYRGGGYGALIKAVLWMIPAPWIALSCPNITTATMVIVSDVIILAIAIYRNWFCVSVKKTLVFLLACLTMFPVSIGLAVWFWGADYQQKRLQIIVNPNFAASIEQSSLAKIRQQMTASQLIGANKLEIDQYLPGGSEYVLTYVIAYLGILASVLLVGALCFLFLRLLQMALRQKNQLGFIMGTGGAVALLIQTVVFILGNTGILSIEAYCPFLTYGGTGILVTYALLGLLLSIYRYEDVISDPGLTRNGGRSWRELRD